MVLTHTNHMWTGIVQNFLIILRNLVVPGIGVAEIENKIMLPLG